MASLNEMKSWLRGASNTAYGSPVGALKKKPLPKKPIDHEEEDHNRERKRREAPDGDASTTGWGHVASPNGSYSVSLDGKDALLLFGKHNGMRISELVATRSGRGYMKWIKDSENFDGALLEIVKANLAAWVHGGGSL